MWLATLAKAALVHRGSSEPHAICLTYINGIHTVLNRRSNPTLGLAAMLHSYDYIPPFLA